MDEMWTPEMAEFGIKPDGHGKLKDNVPPELAYEMLAAFGEGVEVVNIVTGERYVTGR